MGTLMRPRITVTLICAIAAIAIFGAMPLRADQPAHSEPAAATGSHAADPHAAAAGNDDHPPKPALLDWDIGSAVWSIIVFVILLLILRVAAWKPILQGLQQRETFITDSLSKAKHEREEAQRMLADYTAKLHKAREESSAIVEEGRRDAEELRKRINAEAKAEADATVARARRDIQSARDDAIKQLYDQSVMLAANMASKIVKKELTAADHKRLLDESLAELSGTNN